MYFGEKFTAGEMKEIDVIDAWSDDVLWADQCTNPSVQHPIHVVRRRRTWMKEEFARADERNREGSQRWAAEAPARARKRARAWERALLSVAPAPACVRARVPRPPIAARARGFSHPRARTHLSSMSCVAARRG